MVLLGDVLGVPEPSALVLAGTAKAFGLSAAMRRRRRIGGNGYQLRGSPERVQVIAVNPCCDGTCGRQTVNQHNRLRPKR
jgi:hypothetical protein